MSFGFGVFDPIFHIKNPLEKKVLTLITPHANWVWRQQSWPHFNLPGDHEMANWVQWRATQGATFSLFGEELRGACVGGW